MMLARKDLHALYRDLERISEEEWTCCKHDVKKLRICSDCGSDTQSE